MPTAADVLAPFRSQTHIPLADDELASLLLTFPACCVAMADGRFDDEERRFILGVCESLGQEGADDPLASKLAAADRYACLMQFLARRAEFEATILAAIRGEVAREPSTLPLIREMLEGAAEAAGDVSEVERREIRRILEAIS